MKAFYAGVALAAAVVSGNCMAEDLTAAKAEQLLAPVQPKDCGTYYTGQGDADFADIADKPICTYKPRVTKLTPGPAAASAEYARDRVFDPTLSNAWLADCAKMEARGKLSPMYAVLKKHLQAWLAAGGTDSTTPHPGKATFKLTPAGWAVDSAPE